MKKIAAIYARVSTVEKQDFQRQINELKDIAILHGYQESEIEIYAESISGYKKKDLRVQLQQMLTNIENNPEKYGCVYTSEISRIGREPTQTRQVVDNLTDLSVPIYIQSLKEFTIEKNGKRNMTMNIILQVLIEYANLEAKTFKERSKSGMLHSVKQGKAGGSTSLAYGYKKDDKGYLVIDNEEAEIIKTVFDLYKNGSGIRIISNVLNIRNVQTRMNKTHSEKTINFKIQKTGDSIKWSDTQILSIISNTLYKGDRRYKGETIEAPAIISKELFDECTEIRTGKKHRTSTNTYTYLMKDLVVCGCCGRNYFAKYKPVDGGDKVYICSSRLKTGNNCGNVGVNISLLESSFYNEILSSDLVLNYLNNREDLKTNYRTNIKRLELQLMVENKNLESKNNEENRLLDLYISGSIKDKKVYQKKDGEIKNSIISLTERIEIVKKELEQNKTALSNIEGSKANKKMLVEAKNNRTELATIFKQLINKVVINPIDKNTVLATVHIQINGEILPNTVKLFLDISGVRKKPMVFRYKSFELESILTYKNNVLINPIEEIEQDYNSHYWKEYINLSNENVLTIQN